MKKKFWLVQLPVILLISGFVVSVALAQGGSGKIKKSVSDTVPEKNKKIRDIDDALMELDLNNAEIDKELKEIDIQKIQSEIQQSMKAANVDMSKMKIEMENVIKDVDVAKIQAQVQNALKDVDVAKIMAEVQKSMKDVDAVDIQKALKDVDVEKMQAEVQKSMKDVDAQKLQQLIQESVAKIDFEKINKEMEKVKDVDLSKMQAELQQIKPQIEKSIEEAHVGIGNARALLVDYKGLIDGLDKDGLLKKNESYKIEYSNGELIVNGKKVPADDLKKYSDFLKGKGNFIIKKNADGFNVNNEQ